MATRTEKLRQGIDAARYIFGTPFVNNRYVFSETRYSVYGVDHAVEKAREQLMELGMDVQVDKGIVAEPGFREGIHFGAVLWRGSEAESFAEVQLHALPRGVELFYSTGDVKSPFERYVSDRRLKRFRKKETLERQLANAIALAVPHESGVLLNA